MRRRHGTPLVVTRGLLHHATAPKADRSTRGRPDWPATIRAGTGLGPHRAGDAPGGSGWREPATAPSSIEGRCAADLRALAQALSGARMKPSPPSPTMQRAMLGPVDMPRVRGALQRRRPWVAATGTKWCRSPMNVVGVWRDVVGRGCRRAIVMGQLRSACGRCCCGQDPAECSTRGRLARMVPVRICTTSSARSSPAAARGYSSAGTRRDPRHSDGQPSAAPRGS